jgi:hypothetical protein
MLVDTSAKGAANPATTVNAGSAGASPAVRVEQVERMISREVVMVRQSGVQALAVTVKVDSHTSLFLQLTNHNGQIEASVRCEKGDISGLDRNWGQLQESLARQNVQLLPLEDKLPAPNPTADAARETGNHLNDRRPSDNQQQPPRPPKADLPSDDAMKAAIGLTKSKHKPHPRYGWEKWA